MLRDAYAPDPLFTQIPEHCCPLDPVLTRLDTLLDDDQLVQTVKAELARRAPRSLWRGRGSTPVEVILRMLVVKRLYRFSYEQTEAFTRDSLVLRRFCRVYFHRVPDDTTLIRWNDVLRPEILERLNDRVVELARQAGLTRGRKLRADATVVETRIHYPSDTHLLGDAVRVACRALLKAKGLAGKVAGLGALGAGVFRSRMRTIQRLSQQFHRLGRKAKEEGTAARKRLAEQEVAVAGAVQRQAERVRAVLAQSAERRAQRLAAALAHLLPLLEQASVQVRRQVIEGHSLPAEEKLLSVFETHTQVIPRYKTGKRVEFGRKWWFAETEGGIVTQFHLAAQGGGTEQGFVEPTLDRHRAQFGRAPYLFATDRGGYSKANEALASAKGVRRVVMPALGKPTAARRAHERQRWFRAGFRFRAGMEGRIHVLKQNLELKRCRDHGEAGMGRWVGWGVVIQNLGQIARRTCAT